MEPRDGSLANLFDREQPCRHLSAGLPHTSDDDDDGREQCSEYQDRRIAETRATANEDESDDPATMMMTCNEALDPACELTTEDFHISSTRVHPKTSLSHAQQRLNCVFSLSNHNVDGNDSARLLVGQFGSFGNQVNVVGTPASREFNPDDYLISSPPPSHVQPDNLKRRLFASTQPSANGNDCDEFMASASKHASFPSNNMKLDLSPSCSPGSVLRKPRNNPSHVQESNNGLGMLSRTFLAQPSPASSPPGNFRGHHRSLPASSPPSASPFLQSPGIFLPPLSPLPPSPTGSLRDPNDNVEVLFASPFHQQGGRRQNQNSAQNSVQKITERRARTNERRSSSFGERGSDSSSAKPPGSRGNKQMRQIDAVSKKSSSNVSSLTLSGRAEQFDQQETKQPAGVDSNKTGSSTSCSCKASACLKLYCPCFASSGICGPRCSCLNCQNRSNDSKIVLDARQAVLQRDPRAFEPKVRQCNVSSQPMNLASALGSRMHAHQNIFGASLDSDKLIASGTAPAESISALNAALINNTGILNLANKTHVKGCNCRRGCEKKYCVCREAGVPCGPRCTCSGPRGCMNGKLTSLHSRMPILSSAMSRVASQPRWKDSIEGAANVVSHGNVAPDIQAADGGIEIPLPKHAFGGMHILPPRYTEAGQSSDVKTAILDCKESRSEPASKPLVSVFRNSAAENHASGRYCEPKAEHSQSNVVQRAGEQSRDALSRAAYSTEPVREHIDFDDSPPPRRRARRRVPRTIAGVQAAVESARKHAARRSYSLQAALGGVGHDSGLVDGVMHGSGASCPYAPSESRFDRTSLSSVVRDPLVNPPSAFTTPTDTRPLGDLVPPMSLPSSAAIRAACDAFDEGLFDGDQNDDSDFMELYMSASSPCVVKADPGMVPGALHCTPAYLSGKSGSDLITPVTGCLRGSSETETKSRAASSEVGRLRPPNFQNRTPVSNDRERAFARSVLGARTENNVHGDYEGHRANLPSGGTDAVSVPKHGDSTQLHRRGSCSILRKRPLKESSLHASTANNSQYQLVAKSESGIPVPCISEATRNHLSLWASGNPCAEQPDSPDGRVEYETSTIAEPPDEFEYFRGRQQMSVECHGSNSGNENKPPCAPSAKRRKTNQSTLDLRLLSQGDGKIDVQEGSISRSRVPRIFRFKLGSGNSARNVGVFLRDRQQNLR